MVHLAPAWGRLVVRGVELVTRKVDIRLPGKGNSNSHGARPVHQIISMIKWIRTSRLSIKNSLSDGQPGAWGRLVGRGVKLIAEQFGVQGSGFRA